MRALSDYACACVCARACCLGLAARGGARMIGDGGGAAGVAAAERAAAAMTAVVVMAWVVDVTKEAPRRFCARSDQAAHWRGRSGW